MPKSLPRYCLHEEGQPSLGGLALVRGLDFILRLHGETALLGGLDILAPTIRILCSTSILLFPPARLGGLALLIVFTWEISSPPRRDLGY